MAPTGRTARVVTAAALLVGSAGVLGMGLAVNIQQRLDAIKRDATLAAAVSPASGSPGVENYLLVGSDSRAGADPNSPDFGSIGTDAQTQGKRSDTIMVLRYDRRTHGVALLSLPRDLYVAIAGTSRRDRINSAFSVSPATLVHTVQQAVGLPVQHYVEIDFQGFKRVVDAIGGVRVCVDTPVRDRNTGLQLQPGCSVLGGVQALQYTRSRHYERFVGGAWKEDGTADLGRVKRQQAFVREALATAVRSVGHDPFSAGGLVDATIAALTVDPRLDPVRMAAELRPVVGGGIATYSLPVVPRRINGKDVLLVDTAAAAPVLAYFRGDGPAPTPSTSGA